MSPLTTVTPECHPPPPARDGAGLTQGPVSRKLPTGLAGLAGLTMRGAWGVARKRGVTGWGPQFFPLPGKQTKQTLPGSLAQLPPPTTTHTHAHKVLARGGMPGWVGTGRLYGASRGLGPLGYRCGKGAQGGVGILAPVLHPGREKGRPPPHQLLPYDRARRAPLAWLAPV